MIGLFQENGPCGVDINGDVYSNPYSWSNALNMLYIDQPTQVTFPSDIMIIFLTKRKGGIFLQCSCEWLHRSSLVSVHPSWKTTYWQFLDKHSLLFQTQRAPTTHKRWGHVERIVMQMRVSLQTRPMTLHLISIEHFKVSWGRYLSTQGADFTSQVKVMGDITGQFSMSILKPRMRRIFLVLTTSRWRQSWLGMIEHESLQSKLTCPTEMDGMTRWFSTRLITISRECSDLGYFDWERDLNELVVFFPETHTTTLLTTLVISHSCITFYTEQGTA